MTFFNLLSLLSGMAFLTAIVAGKEGGFWGVLTGVIVGIVLSFIFITGWRLGGRWVIQRLGLANGNLKTPHLVMSWTLMFFAIAWITASAVSGAWVTKFLIHLWH